AILVVSRYQATAESASFKTPHRLEDREAEATSCPSRSKTTDTGPKQTDDKFGRGIKGPLRQCSTSNALGSLQWNLEHQYVTTKHPQVANALPFFDRRGHRSRIDDS